MSVVYAVLSTFSIGLSDFLVSDVTKRTRSVEVTSTVLFSGVMVMVVTTLFWPGEPTATDLVYGALAGVANGVAILLLFVAYSRASLHSTAPVAAVVMSCGPVLWDVLVLGNTPSTVASVGLSLGIVAIALSSYERGQSAGGLSGVFAAVLAGIAFSVLLILLSYIGDAAGGSPLLVQRFVAFLVAMSVSRSTGPRIFPKARADSITSLWVGVFAAGAVILFIMAIREGSLAVASVVSSQYAAVAVLLGVLVRGQRMWWWQGLGLGGSSIAVALIAIG